MTPSSIQRISENTETLTEKGGCDDEELEEIEDVIADPSFIPDGNTPKLSPPIASPVEDKFSAAVARTILERLRNLSIPLNSDVLELVAKTPVAQLERSISALEEEAATKGLKSPIAAFKYFLAHNCQPRNDRQSWWNRAASAFGRERRDRLIQAVFEHAGEAVVMFTNGRRLPLAQAIEMTWEVIAALGEPI